jgi:hypothetical protein
MADAPSPVSICHEYAGGPLLTYELSDAQALTLVHPSLLPKPGTGCKNKWREGNNFIKSFRMADGRVRLTISERLVRQRDARFQRLVAITFANNTAEVAHV